MAAFVEGRLLTITASSWKLPLFGGARSAGEEPRQVAPDVHFYARIHWRWSAFRGRIRVRRTVARQPAPCTGQPAAPWCQDRTDRLAEQTAIDGRHRRRPMPMRSRPRSDGARQTRQAEALRLRRADLRAETPSPVVKVRCAPRRAGPAGKARRPRIPGVFERGATRPGIIATRMQSDFHYGLLDVKTESDSDLQRPAASRSAAE